MGNRISVGWLSLANLFRLDGAISLAFGLATLVFQWAIFSTAVDLAGAGATGDGSSLVEAVFSTLSGYYVLVGAMLILLAGLPDRLARRLALIVCLHHAFMGIKGFVEAHHIWATGDPWPDIVIHTAFVLAYCAFLLPRRAPAAP